MSRRHQLLLLRCCTRPPRKESHALWRRLALDAACCTQAQILVVPVSMCLCGETYQLELTTAPGEKTEDEGAGGAEEEQG